MTYPAYVHRTPAAIVERYNQRWQFYRVAEPVRNLPLYRADERK